jgi:hypothetical protein
MVIPGREQHVIQDFSTYNFASNIPLDGEKRYFDTVFTGVQNHALSVLGDGITQADNLPFVEPIIIHATGNIDLADLEITGNRVIIYNTTAGTITIDIGLSTNMQLITNCIVQLYYDGTNWKNIDTFIFHATGNLNLEHFRITGNRILVWNNTAGTITINLNTAASPDNINLLAYNLLDVYFDGNNWRNIGGHIHNNEYIGKLYMLEESDRPNAFVLNNGSQVSPNWTDVDFSAYVETGQYLKGLLLFGRLTFTGNGALNNVQAFIRQNGSSVTDTFQTRVMDNGYSGLGAGILLKTSSIFPVLCDTSGIIEYIVSDAQAALSLLILGYYLESRL